ncbi:large-conductance mechanosensitive channel protein MscL [Secundilactobacillus kimchicus]|uniref:large-conductance mechanosensitive channel protein MscL n=1 Tax=Secundilactobacillus kimchicus TaxID=528209 RepID=UPI001C039100|nr:large-conductance mechanosensitive channel protein MscL [Secundilactobacillus kimchicus]MBT9671797.1 large-conductance mechanosensitive channel protein MscL [Secundilactobacillus kimchicus]
MFKEFKDFINRGNVIDLAVGVIIGGAFTSIVASLTDNLINPLLGVFLGQVDFSSLVLKVGDASFKYGAFINSIINFLIIAFVVFLMVKAINKVVPKPKKAEASPSNEELYLKEIAELLKKQ